MNESSSMPVPLEPSGEAGDRRQLERRNEDRRKIERTAVRSLLALLIAGAAAVLAAVAVWLQLRDDSQHSAVALQQKALDAQLVQLRSELAAVGTRTNSHAGQIAALNRLTPRVGDMEQSVVELRGRVDAGRRAWTLAEARYLLEVANRGLALERDVDSARVALESADARLEQLRDTSLSGVRHSLGAEIQALKTVPKPDLTGIDARLASAEALSANLPVVGSIPDRYLPERTEISSAPGFARAWQLLRSSFTNMISIRRIGKDAVELVSLEEQNVRRQHLQLSLFAARLATLRSDDALFHKNIDAARNWLAEMFDPRDPGVASINETLRELAGVNIAPALPDISGSLRILDRIAFSDKGAS